MTAWWDGSVGYEVYLRSFADHDGDGVGDLAGVLDHLDHLVDLGVDFVWLTPFFPSPGFDHGYDVADYRDVDPLFGSLDGFDELLAACHARGLRLLVDLVPNHTSHQHPWFQRARSSRDDPYRDRYIWRDPAPDGGPPNNWVSHFGGPAWTLDEATGQYYLHLFLPEQPDLNWRNPAVADAFDDIITFWLERGADGFRIDVAHGLLKHPDLTDNPLVGAAPPPGAHPREVFLAYDHRYDLDQPEVVDVYRRWRALADRYDAVLLGEVYLLDPDLVRRYVAPDALHLALYLRLVHDTWDTRELHEVLQRGADLGGRGFANPLSSHDDDRLPTRMGGGAAGRRRALAHATLVAGLPGPLLLYQGDELCLPNVEVTAATATDPIATRNAGATGRDGVRTPVPWTPDPPTFGFTSAADPWLPLGDRQPEDSVAAQRADPGSYLHRFRALIAARHEIAALHDPDVRARWLTPDTDPVVAYARGDVIVAANTGTGPARVELPEGGWSVAFATQPEREGAWVTTHLDLDPEHAAIVRRAPAG